MSTHSHDDDSSSDFGPVASRPVPTPRGGFMARPGMKLPPRHAVVVRVGNAPASDEIPVARSSAPPPPPPSEERPRSVPPVSSREKVTVPALRTPGPPRVAMASDERPTLQLRTLLPPPPESPRALESLPPPSDAPMATSVRVSTAPARAARRGSSWSIVIAAAIGLLLGLVSIATSTSARRGAAQAPESLPAGQELPPAPVRPLPSARASALTTRPESTAAATTASARASQASAPARKKSIF